MKRILIFVVLAVTMSLCSCASKNHDPEILAGRFEFTIVEESDGSVFTNARTLYLIRDLETGFSWLYDTKLGTLFPLYSIEEDSTYETLPPTP